MDTSDAQATGLDFGELKQRGGVYRRRLRRDSFCAMAHGSLQR